MENEVFCVQGVPVHTYVSRIEKEYGFSYEMRLRQALKIKGSPVIITGVKNVGKKTVCKKVLGKDHFYEIELTRELTKNHFWKELSEMIETIEGDIREEYIQKSMLLDKMKKCNSALIIEGFEVLSKNMKAFVAQQIKEVSRLGIRIVILLGEGAEKEVFQSNPDLQGRVSLIYMLPWEKEELQKIALVGLEFLGRTEEKSVIQKMAIESNGSPKIMQRLCLERYS